MPESCGACDYFRPREMGGPNVAAFLNFLSAELQWWSCPQEGEDVADRRAWLDFTLGNFYACRPDLPPIPPQVIYLERGGVAAKLAAMLDWVAAHWLKDGELTRAAIEAEAAGQRHPVFIEQAENWCDCPKHRGPVPNAVKCAAWQGPEW